jgi:hypothetical protein
MGMRILGGTTTNSWCINPSPLLQHTRPKELTTRAFSGIQNFYEKKFEVLKLLV